MRILFDEDVPRPLKRDLIGHEVSTAQEMGWSSVKNGILLGFAAEAGFEVVVTCDRGMQHQQNVPALALALIVLAVPNKKLETIRPLIPEILTLLESAPGAGTLSVVGARG